ncbi:MAG: transporter related protein [Verrucomicrobiales bacterium]|nr:transporter related protein [Verrucomicrobiales bacterium]
MSQPAIIIDNVSKRFRSYDSNRPTSLKEAVLHGMWRGGAKRAFWALDGVSFVVEKGIALGIVGRNGAGKSTLLRLIGGVGKTDSGHINVNGRVGALLDLTAGFHPDLTGRENVFITGVICGLTRKQVAERLDEIVAFAELEKFIDSPVRTYSTGMQMRLGFSIIIHTEPEVLLVDEVLAVGDLAFQKKCMDRIRTLKEKGCTLILVSHDTEQTRQICDRLLWLRNGRVVALGPTEEVLNGYVNELADETRRRTPDSANMTSTQFGTSLRPQTNRFGSQEVQIEAVQIFGSAGPSTTQVASGEPVSVRIRYFANKPVPGPIFSVSLSREDGLICFDTNTAAQNIELPPIAGHGEIVLHLQRVDLAGGKYFVDVGIFEHQWAFGYDYHWHVYPVTIQSPRVDVGFLHPPHVWELARPNESAQTIKRTF